MNGPFLVAALIALSVLVIFVGAMRSFRAYDPVEDRLQEYGIGELAMGDAGGTGALVAPRGRLFLARLAGGEKMADDLSIADLPLTAVEFTAVVLGAALAGMMIGLTWRGALGGLMLGALGAIVPLLVLRTLKARRQQKLTAQLPEVLTLLVGGLRAGYGIAQAIEMLVHELPPPGSKEFARVARAMTLGVPLPRALEDMARRIDTDDIVLVVTAITVQHEMGGNVAQTLETIGKTVRDRLDMLRQVRVLTSHQRMTGYILTGWPIFLGVIFYLNNPAHMGRLFKPDLIWLPILAGVMQVVGFMIIRRIVDIKV